MGFDDQGPATELDGLVGRMIRLEMPEMYWRLSHTPPNRLRETLQKLSSPPVDDASLFGALKDIAKDICDFAYENKPYQGLFFDVVAKDGGVFRVNVSMLRHDAFPGPPIVVLEPKSKETVVYGTRPDGSYRSPGCWDDAMEADYQALMRRVADHTLPASETASEAFVETYNDPEKGRERFMNSRDDLIADGWVKVK